MGTLHIRLYGLLRKTQEENLLQIAQNRFVSGRTRDMAAGYAASPPRSMQGRGETPLRQVKSTPRLPQKSSKRLLTNPGQSVMINIAVGTAGVAQLVEQLICNQQVGGSNPSTSSKFHMGEFQSGQMGQTVNLLSLTSVVRIHPPPPKKREAHAVCLSLFWWGKRRTRLSFVPQEMDVQPVIGDLHSALTEGLPQILRQGKIHLPIVLRGGPAVYRVLDAAVAISC